MIDIKLMGAKEVTEELRWVKETALPYAVRNSLNRSALATGKIWKREMQREFTLRNNWTLGSVKVDRVRDRDPHEMQAVLGSVSSYLGKQEDGATLRTKGKHGKPIPTSFAAGQYGANPRTRLVRKPNRLPAIQLPSGHTAGRTPAQRNAIAMKQAVKSGRKYAFLDFGKHKGLFSVGGRKRIGKVRMLWDLTQRSVTLKPKHVLEHTLKRAAPTIERIHRGAMLEQLKRHGFNIKSG